MSHTFKAKVNTWLIYKVFCTLKWMVEKTVYAVIARRKGALKEYLAGKNPDLADITRIGFRRMRGTIEEHFTDKKLGIETSGFTSFINIPSAFALGENRDGTVYQPTEYKKLKQCFDYLQLQKHDVLIDLGSGKGRTLFYAAQHDLKKVIGIEFKKELVLAARKNLQKLKGKHCPVTIIEGDVSTADLDEGTIFFLFNPFGPATLTSVLDRIKESLDVNLRKIRILYINSVHIDLFRKQDWLENTGNLGDPLDTIWRNRQTASVKSGI